MHYNCENTITQHRLPIDPDVPLSAREMADEVATEHALQEGAVVAERREKANEGVGTIRRRVRELFEGDDYLRFRRFLWMEGIRVRDLMLPPDGPTADVGDLHKDRKVRADTYLREHGVAPELLTRILCEQRDGLAEIFRPALKGSTGTVHPAPNLNQPMSGSPAFAIRPPFEGWQRGFYWANLLGSGFRGDQFTWLVPRDGLIGHQVRLTNDDASDFDFAEAVADTQIAFWFQPAVSGRVSMTIEAQCEVAAHTLRAEDEWGWSDSYTNQDNYLMMHVLHANVSGPSFAATSHFDWQTDVSQDVFRWFIPAGTTVFGKLSSNGAIPAGEPVVVRAGTRTINTSWTNDVVIHSTPDFRWLIRSIAIQMVP
jgi:hypothetical protein